MEFVTYEIGKKLQEKGYLHGYNCFGRRPIYSDECTIKFINNIGAYEQGYYGENIPCPTINEVLKWLRNEHKVYIEPCILADADTDADGKVINEYIYWSFSVTSIDTGDMIYFEYEHVDNKRFDSFEQAALAGIEYALDKLI